MKLPRHQGPLKACPGAYYFARVLRQQPDRMEGHGNPITLLPNTMFICEEIVKGGQKLWARCRTETLNQVEFFIRISGASLMPAGFDPITSPLVLLAAQAQDLRE